jgi:type IVB pilus formation R64 PilN family outer membrane protein
MKTKFKILLVAISSVFIQSCESLGYDKGDKIIETVNKDYDEAVDRRNYKAPLQFMKKNQFPYVKPVSETDVSKPSWFFQEVHRIEEEEITIADLIEKVTPSDVIFTKLLDDIPREDTMSINLTDVTAEDVLNYISHFTGYNYEVSGQTLSWSRYKVESFDLAWLPGKLSFNLGKKSTGNQSYGSSSSQSSSGTAGFKEESANEFITTEAEIEIVNDLKEILPMMLSVNGKFHFDKSNTALVVKDRPRYVDAVSDYVSNLNEKLTRQVAIDVEVIDVEISNDSQLGLDWRLVKNQINDLANVSFVSDFASSLTSTANNASIFRIQDANASASGTALLIEALESQGSVSKRTYPRIVTMNNRVGKIRAINRQSYIQRRSVQSTANVGAQASIIQGDVETGFILYALPKVMKNRDVIMRLTTSLSSLLQLESKGEGDQRVESPRVSDKDFDNTVVIQSGETLLIAGLSSKENNLNDATNGIKAFGFNNKKKRVRVETILAITPTILRGKRG